MLSCHSWLKKKILIIGPYPPPIGGLSIHIKRFCEFLFSIGETDFALVDDSKNNSIKDINNMDIIIGKRKLLILLQLLFMSRNRVIHYHSHSWIMRYILVKICKLRKIKICFTFHSFRDEIDRFNYFKKKIVKCVLEKGDHFIAVNLLIKEKLIKYGCSREKVSVIPAFIKPINNEKFKIKKEIMDFINSKDKILTANASGMRFYEGEDLYGIDMCIELLGRLKVKRREKIGFIFLLPQVEDSDYFIKLKKRIEELKIKKDFLFITDKVEMYPILKQSSIFLRPTNSDGDAISVREAISLEITCIASDVAVRPEGVINFKTRDLDDLEKITNKILNNYDYYKEKAKNNECPNYAEEGYKVYSKL
ncbi:hypothetical protein PM10SUCC1_24310 [Propionigenium maris DSM 9537]|uniref:Uncharacterized protein n=1 Tax=Propionigenium maris DSM 9537 TaxID=1123000 RepID=A0A9W6GMB4_9FUSO|nr:glycosyltransferase [Propionigenium maris]GLI56917.1 hypothetical protein PM10SUCC1_24310 [Propionigenium maris DSM 9537]